MHKSFFLHTLGYVLYHRKLWKSLWAGTIPYYMFVLTPFLAAAIGAPVQLISGLFTQVLDLKQQIELGISRQEYADLYFPHALAEDLRMKSPRRAHALYEKLEEYKKDEAVRHWFDQSTEVFENRARLGGFFEPTASEEMAGVWAVADLILNQANPGGLGGVNY